MMVVIDTSVIVSAVRSRRGASFALVSAIPQGRFRVALSVSLYLEWQAVLSRKENLPPGRSAGEARDFLRYLAALAHQQPVHFLWRPTLRDPDDDMLLELAVASGSRFIITHNVRDFREAGRFGVEPITPRDFLRRLRSSI
ncbi:putative toxin-antitoxin system toxin component, PIN family [Endothiovibrio diazotrophicus]